MYLKYKYLNIPEETGLTSNSISVAAANIERIFDLIFVRAFEKYL